MSNPEQIEGQLLRALRDVGQGRVAEAIGLSAQRMSALVGEGLITRTARIVAALGFRLVPLDTPHYEPEYVQSLETLVRLSMARRDDVTKQL